MDDSHVVWLFACWNEGFPELLRELEELTSIRVRFSKGIILTSVSFFSHLVGRMSPGVLHANVHPGWHYAESRLRYRRSW